jgi:hypothetical protein
VPFKRPIKPVYIRKLVKFIDAVLAERTKADKDTATEEALKAIQEALTARDNKKGSREQ